VAFFDLVNGVCIIITISSSEVFSSRKLLKTYEVTGMSPQSITVAQLLNGLASRGTLYPPLKRTLREPLHTQTTVSQ
jgi:hypothetical protein